MGKRRHEPILLRASTPGVRAQVWPSRLPLAETGGISTLLSVLKDIQLPWSVRQLACQVLNNTVSSATACAEFVRQRGLDVAFSLLDAYVAGKLGGDVQALAKPSTPPAQGDCHGLALWGREPGTGVLQRQPMAHAHPHPHRYTYPDTRT
jgi:hypothetical protein